MAFDSFSQDNNSKFFARTSKNLCSQFLHGLFTRYDLKHTKNQTESDTETVSVLTEFITQLYHS